MCLCWLSMCQVFLGLGESPAAATFTTLPSRVRGSCGWDSILNAQTMQLPYSATCRPSQSSGENRVRHTRQTLLAVAIVDLHAQHLLAALRVPEHLVVDDERAIASEQFFD